MLERSRNRALGPADKAIALAAALLLLAGIAYAVVRLLPEQCGGGLEKAGDECVGVTAGVLEGDPETDSLVRAVADENTRVEKGWKDPENGEARIPYVRIALMMPFTSDATSTMSTEQIRRALAGAHVAQLQANEEAGPRFQLLLANDGKDLTHWAPVVDRLTGMVGGESPLVGVLGMPSSTPETLRAVQALSEHRIPAVGPVLTSADMNAKYLFKTSPSNELFAKALRKYLSEKPGERLGFLVADNRNEDTYSFNLRKVFLKEFGEQYGLRQRQAKYKGVTGDDEGIPRRFQTAAQKICLTGADTVFFAGRDHDLPQLVRRLADEPSCDDAKPIRILKVGIGLDPQHTTPELSRDLKEARITLVDAVSVDPRWWEERKGNERSPDGLPGFLAQFEKLEKEHELGKKPLDDGYTIMYHDAFTVLSQAVGQAFDDINGSGGDKDGKAPAMPTKDDVYNTVIDMSILGTEDGAGCVNCVRGASGTFGFDDSPDTEKWAVCKPVPVIEYPAPSAAEARKRTDKAYYRTHENIFGGSCP